MTATTCPICNEAFESTGTIHEHTWTVHGACHYCGEEFDSKQLLFEHWLTSHDDELSRIDRKRAESEVESLTARDRFRQQGPGAALGSLNRRTVLIAGGTAIAGGAAIIGSGLTGTTTEDSTTTNDDEYQYAVIGSSDAEATITYFGSWKCPYCAQFSTGFLQELIADYVVPGKIAIEFRDLAYINGEPFLGPDAPAAGRAGLAVWNNDPQSYRAYHEYVFQNQPPESQQWATADRLVSFAREAGVSDPSVIRTAITEQTYEDALRATSNAAQNAGVSATPTLVIDGTTVNPLSNKDRTRRLLEDALE